jgi:hypothetical protein
MRRKFCTSEFQEPPKQEELVKTYVPYLHELFTQSTANVYSSRQVESGP